MAFTLIHQPQLPGFKQLHEALIQSETDKVNELLAHFPFGDAELESIQNQAKILAQQVRDDYGSKGVMASFMSTYDLSTQEGISLMCLAEALLRIPDARTRDALIADKIAKGNWKSHFGASESIFVNAATLGLMLTGKVVNPDPTKAQNWSSSLHGWISKTSEPVIRKAVGQAMRILGSQFVMGETIADAIKRAKEFEAKGYTYSYDMLGEAALTDHDAARYYAAYEEAIISVGKAHPDKDERESSGVSIKLSALDPRYDYKEWREQFTILYPKLKKLAMLAKEYNIGLTIDAEEAHRLELQIALLNELAKDQDLAGWHGLGLAVQAYQKRSQALLRMLADIAKQNKRRFMLRLVKGAYWDSEIKWAQEQGLDYYPVYTRKMTTDVSYLVCAKIISENPDAFYAQFATHNAYTVSAIMHLMKDRKDFEFQRLHGMGEELYDKLVAKKGIHCRVYAPVGGHQYLLAYLVRRLLENGANTSFVNQVVNAETDINDLVAHPSKLLAALNTKPHPKIRLPRELFGHKRENSRGITLYDSLTRESLQASLNRYQDILKPVPKTGENGVNEAFERAKKGFASWSKKSAYERANVLRAMGDTLEKHMHMLTAILILEAGKTLNNAINDVREAIDFCRYYAVQAEQHFAHPVVLPGPTGEYNHLSYEGRGVMVCISPWNFPLAIFTGQLSSALVTGNAVLAKPAEQTPFIAKVAVDLFHEAGVPEDVLQLMIGKGSTMGSAMIAHDDVAGVMFTGSTEVAHIINKTLATKKGAIVPFIAETGGQNTMIVDSSALLEQVVSDVVFSAFDSAGQRCSALRVCYVQEDIADNFIEMLKGAMAKLIVGDPREIETDVGPVIDREAQSNLLAHIENFRAKVLYQTPLSDKVEGIFVPPTLIALDSISELSKEVFGPVLHVVRYKASELEQTIDAINSTGFGLTFGMHSRIEHQFQHVIKRIEAGNVYINRNIIGAVVGVQPFGGRGLSGTGPKAGGPNYLLRLVEEKTLSVNIAAMGGNASLLSLNDRDDA